LKKEIGFIKEKPAKGILYTKFGKKEKNEMICIKTKIPKEICEVDDELKAIYHSNDSICIWVFKSRNDRNKFMDETIGMMKKDREDYYISNYK
jgi:hypothetical protein